MVLVAARCRPLAARRRDPRRGKREDRPAPHRLGGPGRVYRTTSVTLPTRPRRVRVGRGSVASAAAAIMAALSVHSSGGTSLSRRPRRSQIGFDPVAEQRVRRDPHRRARRRPSSRRPRSLEPRGELLDDGRLEAGREVPPSGARARRGEIANGVDEAVFKPLKLKSSPGSSRIGIGNENASGSPPPPRARSQARPGSRGRAGAPLCPGASPRPRRPASGRASRAPPLADRREQRVPAARDQAQERGLERAGSKFAATWPCR